MLREIVSKCWHLRIYEERHIADEYVDLVFDANEIQEWEKIFAEIFGLAVKPAQMTPTNEHLRITEDFGGIYTQQTLFKKEFDGVVVIAMFWPWDNGRYVTLKMFRV